MATDVLTPQGRRISATPGFRVAEENGLSVLGSIPSIGAVFELAFNDWQQLPPRVWIHAQIPATYFGLWSGKRTLAEFQLGQWFKVPTDPDAQQWVAQLFVPLQNIRPMHRVSPVNQEASLAEIYRQTGIRWHGSLSTGSTL